MKQTVDRRDSFGTQGDRSNVRAMRTAQQPAEFLQGVRCRGQVPTSSLLTGTDSTESGTTTVKFSAVS